MSRKPLATKQVALLDEQLRAQGVTLKRSQLQEVIARLNGYFTWNHFVAAPAERSDAPAPARDGVGQLMRLFSPFSPNKLAPQDATRLWASVIGEAQALDEPSARRAAAELEGLEQAAHTLRAALMQRLNRGRTVRALPDGPQGTLVCDVLDGQDGPWTLYVDAVGYEVPASLKPVVAFGCVVAEAEAFGLPGVAAAADVPAWLWAHGFAFVDGAAFSVRTADDGAEPQCSMQVRLEPVLIERIQSEVSGTPVPA